MAALELDPSAVEMEEIETDADAERERFIGSPTIRIDGEDIQSTGDEPAGLTCRVYRLRDGRISPLPDRADIREALGRRPADQTEGRAPEPAGKRDPS